MSKEASSDKPLIEELTAEEVKLEELRTETRRAMERIAALRRKLEMPEGSTTPMKCKDDAKSSVISPSISKSGKIALFRSLFWGREDVFPGDGKS